MDKTEKLLLAETEKWLARLEERLEKGGIAGSKEAREQMVNVKAYVSDCRHFLAKKDYIRAFEAVVYAWGIFETLQKLGLLKDTRSP